MQETLWRELYKAALLELNQNELQARISAAQAAIHARIEELNKNGKGSDSAEERQAIADAQNSLRVLQKELGSPS